MPTRSIVLYEIASFAGLVSAIAVVWGNVVFMLAVCAIYIGFHVRYWQSKFKRVVERTQEQTKNQVWSEVIDACSQEEDPDDLDGQS